MSTRWGKSVIVVVVISYTLYKEKEVVFFLCFFIFASPSSRLEKRKEKSVNADICAQVRLRSKCTYIIYLPPEKKKKIKKVKVKYN